MDINVIIASTVGLFVITLLLVTMLLFAKARLLPSGPVKLIINGEKNVEVNSGDTLLTTLGNNKIFLPSACGGGGTCVQETGQHPTLLQYEGSRLIAFTADLFHQGMPVSRECYQLRTCIVFKTTWKDKTKSKWYNKNKSVESKDIKVEIE